MDVNSGERWSKIYISDLTNEIVHGRTMADTADRFQVFAMAQTEYFRFNGVSTSQHGAELLNYHARNSRSTFWPWKLRFLFGLFTAKVLS